MHKERGGPGSEPGSAGGVSHPKAKAPQLATATENSRVGERPLVGGPPAASSSMLIEALGEEEPERILSPVVSMLSGRSGAAGRGRSGWAAVTGRAVLGCLGWPAARSCTRRRALVALLAGRGGAAPGEAGECRSSPCMNPCNCALPA